MLPPLLSALLASNLRCLASEKRGVSVAKAFVRLFAVCAVSPAMVLGPCYGEVMMSLPTGIGALISDSLLPDRSTRRKVEGQLEEQGNIAWAPVFSPWAWSDLGPAWQPSCALAGPPQGFLEFWESSSSFLESNTFEPLMSLPLQTEAPVQGGEVAPAAEIDPELAPGEQNEDGWAPEAAEGAPAAAATDPVVSQGPINPVLAAQMVGECTVMGEVSDKTTLDPIVGAIVTIGGTGREAETDAQGRFRIDSLPAGTYLVEALKLGYSMGSASASPLQETPADIRIALTVKPSDTSDGEFVLAEEVVVGEYRENAQADFELELVLGSNIGSGLDKSEFTKSGISDAAGAVSKIAGANIVGGKYAVVRGLGDRYSNTTVNGALISSADPSRKAVQLDLFPSDLLESINIFKTFTPQYPGEFAGGLVAIETLSFPDEPFVEFEYGIGTNQNLDGDDYYTMPGRDLGFLGKPNDGLGPSVGSLAAGGLSEGWGGTRPPRTTRPAEVEAANEGIAAWSQLHQSGGMRPLLRKPELGQDLSAAFGNTYEFDNGVELGVVASGVWGSGDSANQDVQVGRIFNSGADSAIGTVDDRLERTQREDRYSSHAGYGLLTSIGLRAGRHEVSYTYFQNHRGEDTVQRGRNVLDERSTFEEYLDSSRNPFGAGAYAYQGFDSLIPLQRTLTLNQLVGSHEFGDLENPIELDWVLSRSEALENRANTRTLFFSELDFADPRIVSEKGDVYNPSLGVIQTAADVFNLSPPENESFRESLETLEIADNQRIDLTFPVWSRDENSFFQLSSGLNHFTRDRQVRGRLFINRVGNGLNEELLNGTGGQYGVDYLDSYDSIYEPDGSLKFDGWSGNPNRSDKLIFLEQSTSGRTVRNVDAATDLAAGYLMAEAKVADWHVVGGVRYEEEERSFDVLAGLNPSFAVTNGPVSESAAYWLPGIVISRDFGRDDQFDVTLGWSKTVARPTFYEFAPVITEDQASGDEIEGNPSLKDTRISNYDLRVGWRPKTETSLAISVFNKSMKDPIAEAYELGRQTWVNGEEGSLQGVELEVSQRFFEDWSISSNFTYIDSSLVYSQRRGNAFDQITTTFEGQPNYIFNLNFGYDDSNTGWAANLIYNFTGSYLTGVPLSDATPAVRRDSFSLLDLVIQKRFDILDGVGIVKLKCGNLLDSVDRQVFDGTDLVYESYSPGRTFGLSFKYEY